MFADLSKKQETIVFSNSKRVVVRACPGSGKTFTVAARLANKIMTWDRRCVGISCLSFTNVARQEIEKYLPRFEVNSSQSQYPHFLGTIDSFINRFIFLPFGHLVMGCDRRPVLVGEPYSMWIGRFFTEEWFDKTSFDVKGNFIFTRKYPPPPKNSTASILQTKMNLLKAGYANQDDANYFALQILRGSGEIAQTLIKRFPVLLIDEAQDTTAIQMAIVDELVKAGLEEIYLVGDPDQAIFEWNTADPQLFQSKSKTWECLPLDECRRSSQDICNFVYNLSSLDRPAVAVTSGISQCIIGPQVLEYGDLSALIKQFSELCEGNCIAVNKGNVAVLCRARRKVSEVAKNFDGQGGSNYTIRMSAFDIWDKKFYWCKDICEGKFLIDQDLYKEGYKLIERGCYKALNQTDHYSREALRLYIERKGFVKWRLFLHDIILSLPSTFIVLSRWLLSFLPIAQRLLQISDFNGAVKDGSMLIHDLFAQSVALLDRIPVNLGTVHSVKGETFEAVLVVMESKAGNKKYKTMLCKCRKGELLEEELRTVYVAITRPRKILIFAVPQGDAKMWNDFLQIVKEEASVLV